MGDYIAYEGEQFQIEWYFSENGESQAKEYAENMPDKDRMKLRNLLMMMGDHGIIRGENKFRSEGDGIFAFKPQPHRFLSFFVKGSKIIITNAFKKKQQKLPKNEKTRALNCREDYQDRVNGGTYYEEK